MRVAIFGEGLHRALHDRRPRDSRCPERSFHGFRCTKAMPAFWPAPAKLKPATMNMRLDVRLLVDQVVMLDLLGDGERARLRGADGQRDLRDDRALVLVRQERGRQADEQDHQHDDDAGIDQQRRAHPAEEPLERAAIALAAVFERVVEPGEEAAVQLLAALAGSA